MVSSGTVSSDSQTLQGLFSNYSSQMESVNNDSIWQGPSRDNAANLSSEFVSEYKETIASQLTSFAEALNKYEEYKQMKASKASAESSLSNATTDEQKSYYRNLVTSYNESMANLKSGIDSLLSSITSQKLASATSTVEYYSNLVTLNEFVNYFQGDYSNYAYGRSGTIASAGCGPTSMAMVLTYLTGEPITPVDTAAYSVKNGYRVEGNGTADTLFPAMASEYGLDCEKQSPTAQNIINSLSEGKVIIAHMGPGTFTRGGHYIVLKGLDENGGVIVADPNSRDRTDKSFDAGLIARESSAAMYAITI